MYASRPVIGIAGGIGSGKSFVARLFGEMGGLVISADELVNQAYEDPAVRRRVRDWWGEEAFGEDGSIDRKWLAGRVFSDPEQKRRLEQLLHPWVNETRERIMSDAANDPQVLAFIWDTPLLFETGLNRLCDRVVFVDAPEDLRAQRVRQSRGWDRSELWRRENLQMPLDRKREMSDYIISNTTGAAEVRRQVRNVLSQIQAQGDGINEREPGLGKA